MESRGTSHRERQHDRDHQRDRSPRRPRPVSRDRSRSPKRRRSRSKDRPPHSSANYKSSRRRDRSTSDPRQHSSRRSRHRSPSPKSSSRSKAPLPSQQDAFTGAPPGSTSGPPIEKQKPSFLPSGALAAATNTVAHTSVVLKYNEPPEARLPPSSQPWRMYIFKGPTVLETLDLFTRSCWLFGRERLVVDVPTEHPSCSKQHAVVQFRWVERKDGVSGERKGVVRPYLIDLESANGSRVNGERVPEGRYVELKTGDVVVFGDSTREYVVMLPPEAEG